MRHSKLLVDGEIFSRQACGGISRLFIRLIRELRKADVEVRIFMRGVPLSPIPADLTPCLRLIPSVNIAWKPWRFWHVVQNWINNQIEALYYWREGGGIFVASYYKAPQLRLPSICLVYDLIYQLYPRELSGAENDAIRRRISNGIQTADQVICISESTRRDVLRYYSISEDRSQVMWPASGLENVEPEFGLPEPLRRYQYLLFVGAHHSFYKGFEEIWRFLNSRLCAQYQHWDLAVVSPGSDERAGLRIGDGCGRLVFLGNCSDEQLAGLYQHCSALIYPSLYEGFGLPIVEALQFGAPVVCTDVASLPEAGGEVACYYKAGDIYSFVMALAMAYEQGRIEKYVVARKEQAMRFTWNKAASVFMDVMKRCEAQ